MSAIAKGEPYGVAGANGANRRFIEEDCDILKRH